MVNSFFVLIIPIVCLCFNFVVLCSRNVIVFVVKSMSVSTGSNCLLVRPVSGREALFSFQLV